MATVHQRQLIREAAKAALLNNTRAGTRVFESRLIPWHQVELPAISVYSNSDTVDPTSRDSAPRILRRTLELKVEALLAVPAEGNIDDDLDAFCVEVERALDRDPVLGGVCVDLMLSSTELGMYREGNRPMGAAVLTFDVLFDTDAPAAEDVETTSFDTASITTQVGGATADTPVLQDVVHPENS